MVTHVHRKSITSLTGIVACVLLLNGCGKKANEAPKSEVKPGESKSRGIGPYEVIVPTGEDSYKGSFDERINQNEGTVQYFITQPNDATLLITASGATVTGCNGEKVELTHYWSEDGTEKKLIPLNKGEHFHARGNVRGLLAVNFRNLSQCESLAYKIELKQYVQVNQPVLAFSQSKAVKCKRSDGAEFQMNYPQIQFTTDQYGVPKFSPGTICYGEKRTPKASYQYQWFYGSGQAVYQNGQNQTIQLYSDGGPIAYMEFGYFPNYDSPLAGHGKFSEWYPWGDLRKRTSDMECTFYASSFEECR